MLEPGQTLGPVTIVRDGAGLVRITPAEPAAAAAESSTTAVLDVAGGVIVVDVVVADRAPASMLTEPYWAQSWVAGVYGERVAAALETFVDPEFSDPVAVDAEAGLLTDRVNRIGLGYWLHRWWPSDTSRLPELDEWLLELELGGLAWLAEACFVESDEVEVLLEPHVEKLVAQIEGVRATGHGSDDQKLLDVLTTALRAAVDVLGDDVPGYPEAGRLLATIRDEEATVASAAGTPAWDALLAGLLTPALARRGGGGGTSRTGEVLQRGTTTADWRQLPPRVVLGRDDNLVWRVTREDDGPVIEVRVAASPSLAPDTDEVLFARAYLDGFPWPFALRYDNALGAFAGSRVLPAEPTSELDVDVYSAAFVQRPRLSEGARAAASAERALVFEVVAGRRRADDQFVAEQAAWSRWQG
jgi:hypothetical protein